MDVNDVMHWKRARRILGILKKPELSLGVRRRRETFASSQWPCGGCHTWGGADGKASIERLCLSSYVEKPFNSKVIKSFVPEQRSRKCFSCFGIPMFYVYMLWTFYVHFPYSCMDMLQLFLAVNSIFSAYSRTSALCQINRVVTVIVVSYPSSNP